MSTREFKAISHTKFTAQISIQEQVTYDPAQNGYGDIKDDARPKNRTRDVLQLSLAADTLEKLQAKIVAHVGLAE